MSEKDKSQSKEMAELLAENPEAATYIAGVVQGMKLAKAGAQAPEDKKEDEPACGKCFWICSKSTRRFSTDRQDTRRAGQNF